MRRKVALMLAVPTALAALLGGLQVANQVNKSDNSSTTAAQAQVLKPAVQFLAAAEQAAVLKSTKTPDQAAIAKAMASVAKNFNEIGTIAQRSHLTSTQAAAVQTLSDDSEGLVDGTAITSPDIAIASLQLGARDLQDVIASVVAAQQTPDPAFSTLDLVVQGRLATTEQVLLAEQRLANPTGGTPVELLQANGVEKSTIDRISAAVGADPDILSLQQDNDQRLSAARDGDFSVKLGDSYTLYDNYAAAQLSSATDRLNAAARSARTMALISIAVVGLVLLGSVLLALLISGLLVGPIRRVRDGAIDVAENRLPDAVRKIRAGEDPGRIAPIRVGTHEEIGQLARAVDTLHESAIRLASREAEVRAQVAQMFVTLSRRNNTLVNQQLHLIESLERDEEDPKRLESLFRLDHLASRMRRTADSLVVLADVPIRSATQDDLTMADALHAATAGVSDYQRVNVAAAPDVTVSGAITTDLVHLLSELVDNALNFSPPTAQVIVASEQTPEGVTIEVNDGGLGMSEKALSEINAVLADGGEITTDTARRMGLFVVSRLCQRHGLTAVLTRNDRQGITATVDLPNSALIGADGQPLVDVAPAAEEARDAEVVAFPVEEYVADEYVAEEYVSGDPAAEAEPAAEPDEAIEPDDAVAELADEDATDVPEEATAEAPTEVVAEAAPVEEPVEEAVEESDAEVATETADEPVEVPAAAAAPTEQFIVGGGEYEPIDDDMLSVNNLEARINGVLGLLPQRRVPGSDVADDGSGMFNRPSSAPPLPPLPQRDDERADNVTPLPRRDVPAAETDTSLGDVSMTVNHEAHNGNSEATNGNSTIFEGMRSSWLFANVTDSWATSETDAAVKTVQERTEISVEEEAPVTQAGLPKRNPGIHLVPGGLSEEAAPVARDPEAIRRRLQAHAAGVSRGRSGRPTPVEAQEAGTE